jgi:hypothetical protein
MVDPAVDKAGVTDIYNVLMATTVRPGPARWRSAGSRLALEALLVVGAYLAYEAVRRLVAPDSHEAFGRAMRVIRFEQRLGIFFEADLQRQVIGHDWLVTLCNWVYVWGYLPVICLAGLYLYVLHRDSYARYRNAFLLSGSIGLLVFATLPVAPPRMFPEFGFVDTVRDNSVVYAHFEGSDLVNEFAAMPSFHFGWILLVGIAVVRTSRQLAMRAAGAALPPAMLASIVLTANHYVVDALAGAAIVLLALAAVCAIERRAARMRRRPTPALR